MSLKIKHINMDLTLLDNFIRHQLGNPTLPGIFFKKVNPFNLEF